MGVFQEENTDPMNLNSPNTTLFLLYMILSVPDIIVYVLHVLNVLEFVPQMNVCPTFLSLLSIVEATMFF